MQIRAMNSDQARVRGMCKLVISNADARRLFLDRHALGERQGHKLTHAEVLALVRKLGFVQLDSINIVERAHHMILFSRAAGYAREILSALHHDHRALFEHWTHDASLVPIEFYPALAPSFRRGEGAACACELGVASGRRSGQGDCPCAPPNP